MSDTVITALIMTAGTVICQILINANNRKKRKAESDEENKQKAVEKAVKDEKLETRLAGIEHKLDIHNGYAEKLTNIEKSMAVIENDIKTLYKVKMA